MTPAMTATGNDTFPATMTAETPIAALRRQALNRGLFQPIDWNSDQVPWNRCTPSARLATM